MLVAVAQVVSHSNVRSSVYLDVHIVPNDLLHSLFSLLQATVSKVQRHYTGPLDPKDDLTTFMTGAIAKGPLVMHICKLFPKQDCSRFDAYGRIISGTLRPGDRVRVLGESYTPDDEEDSAVVEVSAVWVYQARYRVPIAKATAGETDQLTC